MRVLQVNPIKQGLRRHCFYNGTRLMRAGAVVASLILLIPQSSVAQQWPGTGGSLADRLRGLVQRGREHYADMQHRAMYRLQTGPRSGSCEERTDQFRSLAPEAIKLAKMSEDVYQGQGDEMVARGLSVENIGNGRTAYQAANGDYYAEVTSIPADRKAIIVYRGTRTNSRSDVATDVANFSGVETPYYTWARELAFRIATTHPGWQIIATGHSLGGGLALAAAMQVAGVDAIAFDPAGVSRNAWAQASENQREQLLAKSAAFVAVGPSAVDPVSAGSIVGLSVIPAHIYAIPVEDGGDPIQRHYIATLEDGLERAADDPVASCGYDVGAAGVPE